MINDTIIEDALNEYLNRENYDLVEVKLSRWKNKFKLLVYVDKDGGITIDDCVYLSKGISELIVKENFFGDRDYRLEVSSPGIDRPLKTTRDFKRNLGKLIELEYMNAEKKERVTGEISEVTDDEVELTMDTSTKNKYSLAHIIRGKIKLQW